MEKAVIFDMDGLMLDTSLTWKEAEIELLADHGKQYDVKIASQYQGMRVAGVVEVMIAKYGLPINQDEVVRLLTQKLIDKYDNPNLTLFNGCKELVESLHRSGVFLLAIASSSPKAVIQKMTQRFGLSDHFATLVSGEEVENGKPAPDVYLKTADILGVKSANCVVLEDAPKGAIAARDAGMKVIAVFNKRFYKPEDFEGITNTIVGSLTELDTDKIKAILES